MLSFIRIALAIKSLHNNRTVTKTLTQKRFNNLVSQIISSDTAFFVSTVINNTKLVILLKQCCIKYRLLGVMVHVFNPCTLTQIFEFRSTNQVLGQRGLHKIHSYIHTYIKKSMTNIS